MQLICQRRMPAFFDRHAEHFLYDLQQAGTGNDGLTGKVSLEYRMAGVEVQGSFDGALFRQEGRYRVKVMQQH